jgi:hypothetical protein
MGRLAPAPVSRSTPSCSFRRRRVHARLSITNNLLIYQVHVAYMARVGRCLQEMLRWGRSARGEVSNARVGRSVEDEVQDDRLNA